MKAAPDQQQRLLDLQALDTRLGQLQHQMRSLPEHERLEALTLVRGLLQLDLRGGAGELDRRAILGAQLRREPR